MNSLHHCGFLFQEFFQFDLLLQVCASCSSLREDVLTRLGARSKSQGSSSKIPNPRKKFNQEFKNKCDAGRAAKGQGLSSPSSCDGSISESSAQGDLGVKMLQICGKMQPGSNGLSKGYGCSPAMPSSSAFSPQATCSPHSLPCN